LAHGLAESFLEGLLRLQGGSPKFAKTVRAEIGLDSREEDPADTEELRIQSRPAIEEIHRSILQKSHQVDVFPEEPSGKHLQVENQIPTNISISG
jgi:hypothetical protein